MTVALITSEIDFDAARKPLGYLGVPHPAHWPAYGGFPVKIALASVAHEREATRINGRLISIPIANYRAAEAGCRISPPDNGNLTPSVPAPFGERRPR